MEEEIDYKLKKRKKIHVSEVRTTNPDFRWEKKNKSEKREVESMTIAQLLR